MNGWPIEPCKHCGAGNCYGHCPTGRAQLRGKELAEERKAARRDTALAIAEMLSSTRAALPAKFYDSLSGGLDMAEQLVRNRFLGEDS